MKAWNKLKSTLGLSLQLAKASFKLRNEGSYLGILWYLLNPLLVFILLLLVFSDRLGSNIPYYPLYLLLGVIMFNFFHQITTFSIKTMDDNRSIIKSIKFPRESLVASDVLRTLFAHIFEIIVFFIIVFFFGISIKGILLYIPVLLLFSLFLYGFSLILASFYVYFIDLENIWLFVSKLLFFATPIFYAVGGQTRLFIFNLFNPLYYFITISRDVVIYNKIPEFWLITGAVIYSLLSFIIGSLIFHKLKTKFAELV